MTEDQQAVSKKTPRERSPSFPFIPLGQAVKRLTEFEAKFRRHPAPAAKAGRAWGMKEKSSQAYQTLAALKAFGFISYEGRLDDRTASLTDAARTYLRAQQESVKREALKAAALKPAQIAKFWADWRDDPPPNEMRLDQLVLKNGYTDSAARIFLKVYDDTITYAGLTRSDKMTSPSEDAGEDGSSGEDVPQIKVGDWVQWVSQGSWQFPSPRRVSNIFQDEEHGWCVSVEGYPGALPMEQIEVTGPTKLITPPSAQVSTTSGPENPVEVFISGGRLQINANVDQQGIKKLKSMLDKYAEILGLEAGGGEDEDV